MRAGGHDVDGVGGRVSGMDRGPDRPAAITLPRTKEPHERPHRQHPDRRVAGGTPTVPTLIRGLLSQLGAEEWQLGPIWASRSSSSSP